jgi:hypothetical protein
MNVKIKSMNLKIKYFILMLILYPLLFCKV